MKQSGAIREPLAETGLGYIRRAAVKGDDHDYFIANLTEKPFDGWLTLGAPATAATLTDPLTGHSGLAAFHAGPAGAAAALTLARGGLHVVLVDARAFPRDKVCGDALIPDAHQALRQLGVLEAVMAVAQPVTHVGCVAPRGGRVDVPGVLAVLPRKQLDDIVCRAAVAAAAFKSGDHPGAL